MRASIFYKPFRIPAFVASVLLVAACANEVEVSITGSPVPVAYCLLNPDAGDQYVRLGRSFLIDENDPLKPPVTDSTVWDVPVTVYIEEFATGLPVRVIPFNPADAPPKDSGYFPHDNLRLFKAEFRPSRLTTYRLYVHFSDDYRILTGTTTIPGRPVVFDPLEIPGRKITLQSDVQFTARWAPGDGRGIFEGQLIVNYAERLIDLETLYQVNLKMAPVLGLGSEIVLTDVVSGNRFFDEMVRQVPVRAGAERAVIGVQFSLFKGGEELALMVSPDLQQTTITSNLNQYTNLVNGIGVFSSLQVVNVNNLMLSNTTINELAHGERTRQLGFKDIHGEDPKSENK